MSLNKETKPNETLICDKFDKGNESENNDDDDSN